MERSIEENEFSKFIENFKILRLKVKDGTLNEYYDYLTQCEKFNLNPRSLGILKNRALDKNIDISNMQVGNEYATAIAIGALHCKEASKLLVSNNNILDSGALKMMDNMGENLLVLDLSYNPGLTMKSYEYLVDIIYTKPYVPLKTINFEGNRMGNSCAFVILDAVSGSSKIKYLNLNKNDLTDQLAPNIKEFLDVNTALISFFIGWNKFTSKGCIDIMEGMTTNKHVLVFEASFNAFGSHPKANSEAFKQCDVKAAVDEYRQKLDELRIE